MILIDISMDISHGMPVYRGREDKRPILRIERDFTSGDVYEARIHMDTHTGTHVDAPLHMVRNGAPVNKIAPDKLVTKCRVIDMTAVNEKIKREDLEGKGIKKGEFILLKTKNSIKEDILEKDFIYLDATGAEYLKETGVAGVGTDGLGIERNQPSHITHRTLMEAGIVIIEGLRLREAEEGEYLLSAAPIKLYGAEAAPARALLLRDLPAL